MLLLVEAASIALLLATASTAAALASPFRRLAPSTIAFASDGTRYAAWQNAKGSPIVVLDTRSGKQRSYAGCAIMNEEDRSAGQVAAAGRFLVGCDEGGTALLDAATGAKTRLPEPDKGEWRAIGARYVEGNADRSVCKHSASEERQEARGEASVERIRIRRCNGRSKTISTAPEPRDLFLAGSVLTWDTGHAGTDVNVAAEGKGTHHGRLWSYQTATRTRRGLPLPQTTIIGSRKAHGVFGYSSHAGETLFWIAARTLYLGKDVNVERQPSTPRRRGRCGTSVAALDGGHAILPIGGR